MKWKLKWEGMRIGIWIWMIDLKYCFGLLWNENGNKNIYFK